MNLSVHRIALFLSFFLSIHAFAEEILKTIQVSGDAKFETRISIRTNKNATEQSGFIRVKPLKSMVTSRSTLTVYELEQRVPIQSIEKIFFDLAVFGSEKNLPFDRFQLKPGQPGFLPVLPHLSLVVEADLEHQETKVLSTQLIDPFGGAHTPQSLGFSLDCSRKFSLRLENGVLVLKLRDYENVLSCFEPKSYETQALSDVRKIGRRKEKQIATNLKNEQPFGQSIFQEFYQKIRPFLIPQDHPASLLVERVASKIIVHSDSPWVKPMVLIVNDPEELNAFSYAGGFLGVTRKLIEDCETEAELAAVLGHEWGHVVASHSIERHVREALAPGVFGFGTLATMLLFRNRISPLFVWFFAAFASMVATPIVLDAAERAEEYQADWLGIQYAWSAGYTPWKGARMFERLYKAASQYKQKPEYLRTHPLTTKRFARSLMYSALMLPEKENYIDSTEEYQKGREALSKFPKPVLEAPEYISEAEKKSEENL